MSQVQRVTDMAAWKAEHRTGTCTSTWTPPGAAVNMNVGGDWHQAGIPDTFAGAGSVHVTVDVGHRGPTITWSGGGNPDELRVVAMALLDAARAAGNGDDINAVAQQEWWRRGGRPEPD